MDSRSRSASAESAFVDPAYDPMVLRRNLFSSMVGEGFRPYKAACRIARDIEEDLITHGWVVGDIRGSELELAQQFGVCREVVREAARILEARGTARMRRGPNGGLQVQRPGEHNVLGITIRYARLLECNPDQAADARRLLAWVRDRLSQGDAGARPAFMHDDAERAGSSQLLDFFETIVEAAENASTPMTGQQAIRPQLRSRATHVAYRIMEDHQGAEWQDGRKLGAEFDLCERYSVDRGVLRQAIRILESEGAVVSKAGRGHGLILTRPGPGAICRLAQCYFASCRLSVYQVYGLFGLISSAAVAFAAERAGENDVEAMAHALGTFDQVTSEQEQAEAIFDVEESQFTILRNPLIDLFLRSTRAFSCWNITPRQARQPDKATYLKLTEKVMAAIGSNDPESAAAAQFDKFLTMRPFGSQ